ncbi:hypothetical protein ACJRPK_14090 [Aquimarina sp. 2-A2]|uniref:hypothetical protein n=1 Tax=Aquimarina sp. 2-A2 TaxID=3382644 RepID=UPI00387EFD36
MSTTIQNRNASYNSLIGILGRKRNQVFNLFIKEGNATSCELSEKYGIPINQIVGRATELNELCLLTVHGSKKNLTTGFNNAMYRPTTKIERIDLCIKKRDFLTSKKDSLINDITLDLSVYSKIDITRKVRKINRQIGKLDAILSFKNIEVIDPETVDANA